MVLVQLDGSTSHSLFFRNFIINHGNLLARLQGLGLETQCYSGSPLFSVTGSSWFVYEAKNLHDASRLNCPSLPDQHLHEAAW